MSKMILTSSMCRKNRELGIEVGGIASVSWTVCIGIRQPLKQPWMRSVV